MNKFKWKALFFTILGAFALASHSQQISPTEIINSLTPEQTQSLQQLTTSERTALAEQIGIKSSSAQQQGSDNKESEPRPTEGVATINSKNSSNVVFIQGEPPLPIFGHEVFSSSSPTTFAPIGNIPVPAEYVLGPGDTIELQLLRALGGRYQLTVNREGQVQIPEIGPIGVSGLRFLEAKALLEQTIAAQMPGTRGTVSLSALRSIQVFVLGEARRPGAYTISGLSTISHALLASGGVSLLGSLRRIELRRSGKLIKTLDLYEFLAKGDNSNDHRLLSGDVIFIPTVGSTVAITGNVKRPAIYEITAEATVESLINLAGGLMVSADRSRVTLNRISSERPLRELRSLNLFEYESLTKKLKNGDLLRIDQILPTITDHIELSGHVHRPGVRPYQKGMRLTDALPSPIELKLHADTRYVLIRRIDPQSGRQTIFSADLELAYTTNVSDANPALERGDRIIVFERAKPRGDALEDVMSQKAAQATSQTPHEFIRILGNVKSPGTFPYEKGMTVEDAIFRAAGGLAERAYTFEAELIEFKINEKQIRQRTIVSMNLADILNKSSEAKTPLEPFMEIVVRSVPEWEPDSSVTLTGEFMFPGTYPIEEGETLLSVIRRAGGLRNSAFVKGAFFSREQLRLREIEQARRVQDDLRRAILAQQREALSDEAGPESARLQQLLELSLESIDKNPALGRLTINLEKILQEGESSQLNVVLRPNDRLFVPARSPEVTVIGEVFLSSSHLHEDGLRAADYIDYSGGFRSTADRGAVYVIRASGRATPISKWGRTSLKIETGDSIIVPLRLPTVRSSWLGTFSEATQIIYQLAIGAAALDSIRR